MIVLEFRSSSTLPHPFSDYSIDKLTKLNEDYNNERGRRQANKVGVYIAANISESDLESGFTLGDNQTDNDNNMYRNHKLRPSYSYNVSLIFHYSGTNKTIIVDATELPICKLCTLSA